ncbi:MAG: glutaredoxin family protein [Gallionella sp.]|nr:glutaredoxin family protein [Gallionella sp.]
MVPIAPSTIELYGISCCHLREEAQAILRDAGIVAKDINIADDGGLLEKYGMRIPVLRRMDNGAEPGWPFDTVAVVRFLA